MTSIPTPSGVWTLRLGGISLLLHRRSWLMFTLLVLVLLGLTVLATSLGSGHLGVRDVIATLTGNGSRLQEIMAFKIRLPRVAAAIIAGLAMGMAGCLIQTLVRNRLATPDMIGVNEGASLAVVVFADQRIRLQRFDRLQHVRRDAQQIQHDAATVPPIADL